MFERLGVTRKPNRRFKVSSPFVWLATLATAIAIVAVAPAVSAYAAGATMTMDWARAICGSAAIYGHNLQGSGLPADSALMVDGVFDGGAYGGVHFQEGITTFGDTYPNEAYPVIYAADGTTSPDSGGTITFNVYDTNNPPNLITSFGPFTVDPCDHLPVAADDSATTTAGNPVTVGVLANDTDADPGTTLTVGTLMSPANGTSVANPDGTVTYTPFAGFTGTDTFQYYPNDGLWDSNQPATVTVTVNPATTTTMQISNLQSTCGVAGFTGHADVVGTPNDTDTYVIQAQLADTTNYPDDFHGPFTPSGGEFHGTVDWQNPIGWEQNPPTTATAVQFDLYDYTTSLHLATFSSTLPACTPANTAPTASFTSSTNGLTASFDASASSDADGSIASYGWNFGDGATGSGVTTQHSYASGGTYSVTLTVTDNQGATNSVVHQVTVAAPPPPNQAPVASLQVTPTSGSVPLAVTASGSGSTDDNGVTGYKVDWGDGSNSGGFQSSSSFGHTYGSVGSYTATLTVEDAQGLTSTASQAVTVSTQPTALSIARSRSSLTYGQTVAVTGGLLDNGQALAGRVVWLWYRHHGSSTWYRLGYRVTDSVGHVGYTVKPGWNIDFQWRYGGDATTAASNSNVLSVLVHVSISAKWTANPVHHGNTVALYGSVAPNRHYQWVVLQRYYSGRWHSVVWQRLNKYSQYKFTFVPKTAGKYIYRVAKAVDAYNLASASATRVLTVS